MARYECPRCLTACNTTNPPHLCKDVEARLKEYERALVREECVPQRGSLEGWLKRMAALDPRGRPPKRVPIHEFDKHHGMWVEVGTRERA